MKDIQPKRVVLRLSASAEHSASAPEWYNHDVITTTLELRLGTATRIAAIEILKLRQEL